jgi:uncharacterized membrane protein YedE/YeeE
VNLIGILVAVGGLVAMLGSASLSPGVGQLLVGMLGLALVLAALAVLRMSWSLAGKARFPRASVKAPPPELEEDELPPPPTADAPDPNPRP